MIYRVLAASAVLLAACGDSSSSEPPEPSDAVYITLAQDAVKQRLRDPDSAEFSDVHVSRRAGVVAVCGYVNSRNGFGGMSGRQRFISGGATGLEEDFAEGEMDASWAQLC